MANGFTTSESGNRLHYSNEAIRDIRRALYRELGAKSGPHAVALAIEKGHVKVGDLALP